MNADGVPTPQPSQPWQAPGRSYPSRITDEFAPWTLDFLERYPVTTTILSIGQLFAKPLIFLAVLLTLGLVFSGLVRHIVDPPAKDARSVDAGAAERAKRFAKWNLVVWLLSFLMAWEAISLHSFAGSVGEILGALVGLVRVVVGALVWLFILMTIAYSFSTAGRDFVMSLLGWWYLTHHQAKPREGQMFDLGEGKMGSIKSVDMLQTTFILPGGEEQTMPNSWLMREHFHWDKAKA